MSAGDQPADLAALIEEARAQAGVPEGDHHHIPGGPVPVPAPYYDHPARKDS